MNNLNILCDFLALHNTAFVIGNGTDSNAKPDAI